MPAVSSPPREDVTEDAAWDLEAGNQVGSGHEIKGGVEGNKAHSLFSLLLWEVQSLTLYLNSCVLDALQYRRHLTSGKQL